MTVNYNLSHWAWLNYRDYLKSVISTHHLNRICDVGGGAKPTLPIDYIEGKCLDYHVYDISDEELSKADKKYHKRNFNFVESSCVMSEQFDLIFSIMTMEHIKDVESFHKNIYQSVKKGGFAFHFFPCITSLPMLVNKMIPDNFTGKIVNFLQPTRDKKLNKKFPAFYEWCLGPIPSNIKKFKRVGFSIVEYSGFYGHSYYDNIPVLRQLEKMKSNFLVKHPSPYLAINAYVLLKKE